MHNILQRNQSEMVRKIYELQKINPCPGDFYEIVRDDMLLLDLNLTEDDISKMKKQAGAELCQAQPQAVLTGFPLASG